MTPYPALPPYRRRELQRPEKRFRQAGHRDLAREQGATVRFAAVRGMPGGHEQRAQIAATQAARRDVARRQQQRVETLAARRQAHDLAPVIERDPDAALRVDAAAVGDSIGLGIFLEDAAAGELAGGAVEVVGQALARQRIAEIEYVALRREGRPVADHEAAVPDAP